jgi:diacylglycerol kinase (ATP)
MTQRALLLINRHARRGQLQVATAIQHLQTAGIEFLEVPIASAEQISATIRHYHQDVNQVIIGGGDGTLNAAIAGLIETQLPLGILPLGTANDLARTLNIPVNLADACRIIAAGKVQPIDLGWVNDHYFFNVASLGLSVQITKKLTKEAKQRWGVLAYALTALQVLRRSRPFHAEIATATHSTQVKTVQIAVGNGRYYGGGLAVAADAKITDERLDLYSLELNHWWRMIALLPALWRGEHAAVPQVRTLQGQEFYISTRRPRPIATDGEITTFTPAHFRVIANGLPVFVP